MSTPIQYVFIFMALMSLVLFVSMGADKAAAKRARRRIPERRLFVLAILGGALGGTLGMFLFRHKTRHWYFRFGFPLIAALQIILCICAKA